MNEFARYWTTLIKDRNTYVNVEEFFQTRDKIIVDDPLVFNFCSISSMLDTKYYFLKIGIELWSGEQS